MGESCSHIGALLFKVEAAVRLGYTAKDACTSEPCKWNNDFVTKIPGAKIKDISFQKVGKKQATNSKNSTGLTEQSRTELLRKLSVLPHNNQPVILSTFAEFSGPFHHKASVPSIPKLPIPLREFYSSTLHHGHSDRIYQQIITEDDRDFIEKSTRAQSDCLAWHQLRTGRITASIAHQVLHTDMDNPSKSLILKICMRDKKINTPPILWGRGNEENAIQALANELKKSHINVKVEKSGLRLHQDYHFIGASADGLGSCDCHGKFLIEVKCPFKHKEKMSIKDCLADKAFCINDELQLKMNHQYMTQVQLQMNVYNIKMSYFGIWTPNFFYNTAVNYDHDFENNVSTLVNFHKRHIADELVTRKLELGIEEEKAKSSTSQIICVCQQPEGEDDNIIGCDNPSCKFKWFHFSCIKLKRPPKGEWYCKWCKKDLKKANKV